MRWKKILIAAVVLIVVLISAIYVFLAVYDFNRLKPLIAQALKDATGRELTIAGNIEIDPGIRPTIVVEDVSFQNAAWSTRPDLGRVKRLEVQMAVWPLMLGNFDFAHLVLIEPNVIVEFDRAGTSNFSFDTAKDGKDDTEIQPPPLIFNDVLIKKGLFTYQDAQSGFKFSITIDHLRAAIPGFDKSLKLDFKGAFDDIPFTLEGTVGPIWAWVAPGYPLPADFTVGAGGASAQVKGEVRDPTKLKNMTLAIAAEGSSVSEIAKLAGVNAVPELGAFKVKAGLTDSDGKLAVEGLDIQVGSEALAAISLSGTVKDLLAQQGVDLNFVARGNDAANLVKFGLPPLPSRQVFSVSGRISDSDVDRYAVDNLKVVLGQDEINGRLDANLADTPPNLTADLTSEEFVLGPLKLAVKIEGPIDKLALNKLDLLIGSANLAEIKLSGAIKDLIGMQGVNLDFGVQSNDVANLKAITGEPLPVRGAVSASGKVIIPTHRNLKIPELKISAGKNNITGSLALDLRGKQPQLEADLSLPKLDLPSVLLPDLAGQGWAKGLGLVRPVKLAVTLAGFSQEIALKKVDLRAGTLNSAELRLTGSVANLMAQRGIDLKFSLRGNEMAKLKDITAQPYLFAPVPGQGAYAISGQISDPTAKVYKVKDFKLKMADTELTGRLDFSLADPSPVYEVEMSGPKFNLKWFPLPKEAAYANLNKIDDLGPLKIHSKVVVDGDRLSMPNLEMRAGHEQLASIVVKGSIKNLTEQTGINLNFNIQGNEIANLKKITGQTIPLKGAYGLTGKLSDPAAKKYTLSDLKLKLGKNNITGQLNLNLADQQPELAAKMSAPKFTLQPVTVAAIKPLTDIEDLGPLKLAVNLAGFGKKMAITNMDLNIGSEQLAAIMLKGTVKDLAALQGFQLEFAVKGTDVANLKKVGGPQLPMRGPFHLSGQLADPSPKVYKIPALAVTLGENDAEGSLELNLTGKRPRVTADLSSQNIDLRPVLATADRNASSRSKPKKSENSVKKRDKIFSNEPLHLEWLQRVDADLKIRNKQVLLPQLALDDIAIDLKLEEGNLSVDPIKMMVGGGTAGGWFKLLTRQGDPAIDMDLDFDTLDLGAMFDELGTEQMTSGKLDGGVEVSGRGNSLATLMAGLSGRTYLVRGKGRIAKSYLDLISMNLGGAFLDLLNPFQDKKDHTVQNCAVNRIEIVDGLADVALLLDTEQTTIIAAGDINLKKETLSIGIKPSPKKGFGASGVGTVSLSLSELSKPFKLGGTLAQPALAIDPGRTIFTLGKLAGALALGPAGIAAFLLDFSGSDENACLKAIESAKAKAAKKDEKKKSGGFFKRLFGK